MVVGVTTGEELIQRHLIYSWSTTIEQVGIGYLHGFIPELNSSSGTWCWDIHEVLKHVTWIGYVRKPTLKMISFELKATRRVKLKSISNI